MPKVDSKKTFSYHKEISLAGFGDKVCSIRRILDDSLIAYLNNKGQLYFPKVIGLLECKSLLEFVYSENIVDILQNR